jgi:hypothetical protein
VRASQQSRSRVNIKIRDFVSDDAEAVHAVAKGESHIAIFTSRRSSNVT